MLKENLKSITPGCLQALSAPSTSCLKFEASFLGGEVGEKGVVGLGWVGPAVKDFKFLRTAKAKAIPASRESRKTFSLQTPCKGTFQCQGNDGEKSLLTQPDLAWRKKKKKTWVQERRSKKDVRTLYCGAWASLSLSFSDPCRDQGNLSSFKLEG